MKKTAHFLFTLIFAILLVLGPHTENRPAAAQGTSVDICRFGITIPGDSSGYDVASLGVSSYLNWSTNKSAGISDGIDFIRVLRLRNDLYSQTKANVPQLLLANPAETWIIGNEPDTSYEVQDSLTAEVYADRYFEIAKLIRAKDLTAKLAFGAIVQPTPIRLRYLDRAWNRLVADAGSAASASALIDIWSIHSFILNEKPNEKPGDNEWGTGVPPGFENDHADAFIIDMDHLDDTHSNQIFEARIRSFRSWMMGKGERNKPLWITEYGSLLPTSYVSDAVTADYMTRTFDFLLSAGDANTGKPGDNDRLVQKWFWYSLNEHRDTFGGSLYDPDNGRAITPVGTAFINYTNVATTPVDLFPKAISANPLHYNADHSRLSYQVTVQVGNTLGANTGAGVKVWLYDGDPASGGTLIGAAQSCGGGGEAKIVWNNVDFSRNPRLYAKVSPVAATEKNPSNNQAGYDVSLGLPKQFFLPLVRK